MRKSEWIESVLDSCWDYGLSVNDAHLLIKDKDMRWLLVDSDWDMDSVSADLTDEDLNGIVDNRITDNLRNQVIEVMRKAKEAKSENRGK